MKLIFKLNREEIIRNNMVETARREIGNTGEKYWTWYGFNRRVLWCCVFVSWVANENNVLGEPIPKFIWVKKGVDYYKERNALKIFFKVYAFTSRFDIFLIGIGME
ncbi:MAG: hypothetical protein L6V81_06750 [Clostridium sp.]|nr:MAG: hypothetical protein L6V81_06750 [Clostridium sp.]